MDQRLNQKPQANAKTVKAPPKPNRHVQRTVELTKADIAAIEASEMNMDGLLMMDLEPWP